MSRSVPKERNIDMYKAIMKLQSLEECCQFFEDICAMTELQSMEQRFEVARLLKKDTVYTEIKNKTNASTATISRVNRMLNYGTGCLGTVLERMEEEGAEEV